MSNNLPGFNVLLMGESGTGKTYSIKTLVETGLKVRLLMLEPGIESLIGAWADHGQDVPDNLAWHYIAQPKTGFKELAASAKRSNTLPYDTLAKAVDPDKGKYTQFINILECCNDFVDDRTGESLGAVDEWGTDTVFVIDGLSGISDHAMALIVGGRPAKSQQDWGHAQHHVRVLIQQCTDGARCHFVLLSHVERETDMVTGGNKLMASTLGKALAPFIPRWFSDVILAKRDGDKWSWSTADSQVAVKTRNLAMSATLKPSFAEIYAAWRKRDGQ